MEETVGIIAACIPTLKPLFTGFSTQKWKGRSQRSRFSVRQSLKHRLNTPKPDPYPIESAFHLSAEDIVVVSGDTDPSTATNELTNAPMQGGDHVKGPAECVLNAIERDLSPRCSARMIYSQEEQVVADQV